MIAVGDKSKYGPLAALPTLTDITAPNGNGSTQTHDPHPEHQAEGEPETEQKSKVVRKSQATQLLEFAESSGLDVWHTSENIPYATIQADGHKENWPLKSMHIKRWLARLFYKATRATPGSQAIQDAVGTLEGRALFDGEERPVYVRVARHEGNIYFDMANDKWQAIEVIPRGWRIVDESPVKFRRAKGMEPLVMPERGGHVDELRPFLNLESEDDWVLLVAYLLAALRPEGPYPILSFAGEQGTAKSTSGKLIRALVDPSTTPLRSEPRSGHDLMIAATNAWVLAFDNLSSIPPWLSDSICRLSTGGGWATRELYADSEETIFDAQRPIMITAIADVLTRGDALDRAIILTQAPIPDSKRRPESALWEEFEQVRPRILGALLDAVSTAMLNLPTTKLDKLPRMADFALWATAGEQALGLARGRFMEAYTRNRANASSLALDSEPIAVYVRQLMEELRSSPWEGTATKLLDDLNKLAGYTDHKNMPEGWPKRGDKLSAKLTRVAPGLRSTWGIDIKRLKTERKILITSQNVQSSGSSVTSVVHAQNGQPEGAASAQVASQPEGVAQLAVFSQAQNDATNANYATVQGFSNGAWFDPSTWNKPGDKDVPFEPDYPNDNADAEDDTGQNQYDPNDLPF